MALIIPSPSLQLSRGPGFMFLMISLQLWEGCCKVPQSPLLPDQKHPIPSASSHRTHLLITQEHWHMHSLLHFWFASLIIYFSGNFALQHHNLEATEHASTFPCLFWKSTRSHCGDCINYHVFLGKVLESYFKMTGSVLSRNLHQCISVCPEREGVRCLADVSCHSTITLMELRYFLLQLRIRPTISCRRLASISNHSLVILAAYLCVQKPIIAGMHSFFCSASF